MTTVELREASELFSRRLPEIPTAGPNRLLEHCLLTVLRYLDDDEVITLDENEDLDESEGDRVADHGWTRGELLREQAGYLESPLKSALLEMSSLQPEGSALRLSDVSLKAMLGYSDPGQSSHPSDQPDEWDGTSVHSTGSWETADTTLPHLPLILHPAPHAILRLLPSLHSLSLTSLNLAYSTEPMELEKLVNVLPAGLRELGLAGIRIGRGKSGGQEEWRRGLGVLSRKLIVLRVSHTRTIRRRLMNQ